MRAAICQPEHLPWLGWFDKARQVDVVVLLDSVQFKKRYFENRNRIRTKDGSVYLTVPVLTKGRYTQRIQDVEIDPTSDWQPQHWKALQMSYGRAPHFQEHSSFLEETYLSRKWTRLAELNEHLIRWGLERLGLKPRIERASDLGVEDKSSALLARLCEKLGASEYLSGVSGKDYLDEAEFSSRGVRVIYQEFRHPVYAQLHGGFEPCMSFVDLLFNHGRRSGDILVSAESRLDTIYT